MGFLHSVSRCVHFYLCPLRVFSIQCLDMWVFISAIYRFFSIQCLDVWVFISAVYRFFSIQCLDVWVFISAIYRFFSIQCLDVWVFISAIYRFFSTRAAQQCAIDAAFLDLIPEHYSNVAKQAKVSAECRSRVNPLHRCAGPAIISVRVSHPFLVLCVLS